MKTFWLKSRKWKRNDLDGKRVEFCIKYGDAVAEGVGKFIMRGNGVEKLAADIIVGHHHSDKHFDNYYHLPDSLFEKIEIHPDKSKADFQVHGLFDPGSE
jgi:hypothetical protein